MTLFARRTRHTTAISLLIVLFVGFIVSTLPSTSAQPPLIPRTLLSSQPQNQSPLPMTPDWTAESNQAGSEFGFVARSAGDVNADGYADVITAARSYTNGEQAEGRAYLYLGSAQGLATIPAWTAENNIADAWLGLSLDAAGDVNGDGYGDVVIGAPMYQRLGMTGGVHSGWAYLYYGTPTGLEPTPAWAVEGDQPLAQFGCAVAGVGDINRDGYTDILIGARGYTTTVQQAGRAYLYFGGPSGLSTTPSSVIDGTIERGEFGLRLAGVGDTNADGFPDVLITSLGANRVSLYLGSVQGLTTSPAWTMTGDQSANWFGISVAKAGDINRDGFGDVLIGAAQASYPQTLEGRAYLYYGTATGLADTPAWMVENNEEYAHLGYSVAGAGDLNHDGFLDVLVGAPAPSYGQPYDGHAYLYLGSAAGLSTTPGWTSVPASRYGWFGVSVADAGDVNGDGTDDVLVGAFRASNGEEQEGQVYLYHGRGLPSPTATATGVPPTATATLTATNTTSPTSTTTPTTTSTPSTTSTPLPQPPGFVFVPHIQR